MTDTTPALPPGWAVAALAELVRIRDAERVPVNQTERAHRSGDVPYYGATGQVGWIDKPLFNERLVLLGEDGAPFLDKSKPKAYVIDGPSWVNNHAHVLEPDKVDALYLKYALDKVDYGQHVSGSTRLKLTQAAMKRIRTPLPPRDEQRRIVAEIERRVSHLDAAEASLGAATRKTAQARAAVLHAAANGTLLETLPGSDAVETCQAVDISYDVLTARPGWVRVRLGDIAKVGSGATPKRGNARYWSGGTIPWVTSGQVVGGVIRKPTGLITEAALAETSVRLWPAGTLLVAMYGEGRTRGHCAVLAIEATCNQACAAIRLHPEFADAQPFVKLVLQARYEENRTMGGGGVQENLNLGLIKDIVLDLPPRDAREALVADVDRRLSLISAAEAGIARQSKRTEAARRAVLGAAFRGELVPQDPADEPAEQLLERIREQRAAASPVRRPRRAAAKESAR